VNGFKDSLTYGTWVICYRSVVKAPRRSVGRFHPVEQDNSDQPAYQPVQHEHPSHDQHAERSLVQGCQSLASFTEKKVTIAGSNYRLLNSKLLSCRPGQILILL
jgi:hypothetical protein